MSYFLFEKIQLKERQEKRLKEKRKLKITFVNPNTEEQIVQAMAGVLAYNLAEKEEKVVFDYKKKREIEEEEEWE